MPSRALQLLCLPDIGIERCHSFYSFFNPAHHASPGVGSFCTCDSYKELAIDKKITYGLGQILLFYGASGVGKTMTANAIACKLKKKVLLVNFPSLGLNSPGEIIKMLFREARIKKERIDLSLT